MLATSTAIVDRKEARKAYTRAWRAANYERYAAALRIRQRRRGAKKYPSNAVWSENNRERSLIVHRVSAQVHRALRSGVLVRPTECTTCGTSGRIEAAHFDYAEPLNVRWLCVPCHRKWDHKQPKSKAS